MRNVARTAVRCLAADLAPRTVGSDGALPLHRGRRAVAIENSDLQVTVLEEGGHIAEVVDKRTGINPLWTPAWPSVEPSAFDPTRHTEYGTGGDAKLLAGIMGHNLCLDIFGGPSDEEAAAGLDRARRGIGRALRRRRRRGIGSPCARSLPLAQLDGRAAPHAARSRGA